MGGGSDTNKKSDTLLAERQMDQMNTNAGLSNDTTKIEADLTKKLADRDAFAKEVQSQKDGILSNMAAETPKWEPKTTATSTAGGGTNNSANQSTTK